MYFYNIKNKKEKKNFLQAVKKGIGKNQGLFFPEKIYPFSKKEIKKLLKINFIDRSVYILQQFIENEIPNKKLKNIISSSFSINTPIIKITNNISAFELFHGPTLSFKDFGSRFMAGILQEIYNNKKIYIITATSGDTGAAVAKAFYKIKNIQVIILYPEKNINILQKKLFCTLGKNITSIIIPGNFDDCQKLVKQAFNDSTLKNNISTNSANSINISRLLAQICYYFELVSKLPFSLHNKIVISVPCGNFGNITAGLLAKSLGLPIKKFIIATNKNDTIPRYLKYKKWKPKKTINTISNAMDISKPNNWPRIIELFLQNKWNLSKLDYGSVTEKNTIKSIKYLQSLKYIAEPHTAIAFYMLNKKITNKEFGIFLGTAHPIKFYKLIKKITKINITIPKKIQKILNLPDLSKKLPNNFQKLKKFILQLNKK